MTATPAAWGCGVEIAGTGHAVPERVLSNADLERVMDTSDEWIVQRTGIRTRHIADRDKGESVSTLGAKALRNALDAAKLRPDELDLILCSTMTAEMPCPPAACMVSWRIGAGRAGAMDINGACCGFVFGLNIAHDLIRGGAYRTIGLIGADQLTSLMNYSTAGRNTAIIFGDAAGAVVLRATNQPSKGIIAQAMHSEGAGWKEIYVPLRVNDLPEGMAPNPQAYGHVQMNGSGVFKFAVSTFPKLIEETLEKANLAPADVDMYVCHQSNARILLAARERFNLAEDKLYVNIDRFGNTVAASVPLCLDELVRAGRVHAGMKVMFLGFGGGLTWGSSLWQL